MHDIEPYQRWKETYAAELDEQSPFFGRVYNDFEYTHQLYNYYLHPWWDDFGSSTLYGKILFVDYDEGCALIELIGEWNDTLHNDIMYLKRNIGDHLYHSGITKYVFFCEHVLNFHAALEDDYYAEWAEEVQEEDGWIAFVNTRTHVMEELFDAKIHHYVHLGPQYNDIIWQTQKPLLVFQLINALVNGQLKRIE